MTARVLVVDDVLANVKIFKTLTEDEEAGYNDQFSQVTGN